MVNYKKSELEESLRQFILRYTIPHIRYKGDWDEIVFRDSLLANSETAKEYAQLKMRLKSDYEFDRDGTQKLKVILL